jgi:hypothetical protein
MTTSGKQSIYDKQFASNKHGDWFVYLKYEVVGKNEVHYFILDSLRRSLVKTPETLTVINDRLDQVVSIIYDDIEKETRNENALKIFRSLSFETFKTLDYLGFDVSLMSADPAERDEQGLASEQFMECKPLTVALVNVFNDCGKFIWRPQTYAVGEAIHQRYYPETSTESIKDILKQVTAKRELDSSDTLDKKRCIACGFVARLACEKCKVVYCCGRSCQRLCKTTHELSCSKVLDSVVMQA